MTRTSALPLRVLHAVRVLGFADVGVIADRVSSGTDEVAEMLRRAEGRGLLHHGEFGGQTGWSLTDEGRIENERQLAEERLAADPGGVIAAVHHEFLPLNARLLRAVTGWQLRPTDEDQFAPNDHSDSAWDGRVLVELSELDVHLAPLVDRLSGVLVRFDGYRERFSAALRRAWRDEYAWVDATSVDSCHRVWFQLHEDLVATLGIERGAELADP